MDEPDNRITPTSGMTPWRAGCGGSRTSGSEGGPEKPTCRKIGRALRPDPYTYVKTHAAQLNREGTKMFGCRRSSSPPKKRLLISVFRWLGAVL